LAGVLVGLLSAATGLIALAIMSPQARPPSTRTPVAFVTTMVEEQVKRKVYPYSVVPGGAENLHQAKWAMTDPAVKANYTNIDFAKLKEVKLTTNLSGYVSYRWGEKIYWTAKTVTLRAGERVFTDGTHIVRGRCLNCYSALPMQPTRAKEPTQQVLDTPVEMPVTVYSFPKLPVFTAELPPLMEELTPSVPVLPPASVLTPGKPGRGIWFPILPLIPIIPPIHRHPPSIPISPLIPVIPPVAIVPEPKYGWFLAAGFLAMALTHGLRRRVSADK